jgi:hypothetical protein
MNPILVWWHRVHLCRASDSIRISETTLQPHCTRCYQSFLKRIHIIFEPSWQSVTFEFIITRDSELLTTWYSIVVKICETSSLFLKYEYNYLYRPTYGQLQQMQSIYTKYIYNLYQMSATISTEWSFCIDTESTSLNCWFHSSGSLN